MKELVRVLCVTLLVVILSGSDPLGAGAVGYLPPTTPEDVVRNVVVAYLEGDAQAYLACLAEEFVFVPDPHADGILGGNLPSSWGRGTAARIHQRMFEGGAGVPGIPEFRDIRFTLFGAPESGEEHGHPDWLVFRFNVEMDSWIHGRPAVFASGHTMYLTPVAGPIDAWEIVRWQEEDLFGQPAAAGCDERAPEREVISAFRRGILRLPEGVMCAALGDVAAASSVESLLVAYEVELVRRSHPGFDRADTLAVAHRTGEIIRLADLSETYNLRLPAGGDRESLAHDLLRQGLVDYAELDGPVRVDVQTSDEEFDEQWALNPDTWPQYDSDIRALGAWEVTTGSADVRIAVIDHGFKAPTPEEDHEDLADKIDRWLGDEGWNPSGHGFGMACIAAAATDNGLGVAGVDWEARLMSTRMDIWGSEAELADAIRDAAANADILNCSWIFADGDQPS